MTALLVALVVATQPAVEDAPAAPRPVELGPSELPAVGLSYEMSAVLDAPARAVDGLLTLRWRNPTGAPVTAVPLHLYLNAFSHSHTTWARGADALRDFDFTNYTDAFDDPFGWIDLEEIVQITEAGERPAAHRFVQPDDGNPLDRSLAEVQLPAAVPADGELVLRVRFRSRLPVTIARTGAGEGWFHVAQWFPKIGVWDPPGVRGAEVGRWAARQFHGPTEFYADFADWRVSLEVPAGWTVVATGRSAAPKTSAAGRDRHLFVQRAVHDFAWVATRDAHLETHRHDPDGPGAPVDISYLVPAGRAHQVPELRRAAERTFDVLGARVGPYPYDTMKVIAPPWRALESAGMEYPTLVTAGPGDPLLEHIPYDELGAQASVTAHEIAHNYFYGLLASDEQREAFLDEGFTNFWEWEIMNALNAERPLELWGHPFDAAAVRRTSTSKPLRESPLRRPAALFYPGTTGAQVYRRSAEIFTTARRRFGAEAVDAVFATYFRRFRFRHPTSDDFFATLDEVVLDEVAPPALRDFVREAYLAADRPDFAVDEAKSEPWRAPVGWIAEGEERVRLDDDAVDDERRRALALDPRARDAERAHLRVIDPGTVAADGAVLEGAVQWVALPLERGEPAEGYEPDDDAFFRTRVRLTGPAWEHLPVDVRLVFADGAGATWRWPARAAWTELEVVRGAPLHEVLIDPDGELALDRDGSNDGVRLDPASAGGGLWAGLLTHAAAWLATSLSWWL